MKVFVDGAERDLHVKLAASDNTTANTRLRSAVPPATQRCPTSV